MFFQLFWWYSLTQPKSRTADKCRGKCKEWNNLSSAFVELNTNMRGEGSIFFILQLNSEDNFINWLSILNITLTWKVNENVSV